MVTIVVHPHVLLLCASGCNTSDSLPMTGSIDIIFQVLTSKEQLAEKLEFELGVGLPDKI